jgi:YidC/Oxa1 family membrane protein insertase
MERRVFLAILLSFVVLAGYQSFFAPAPPPISPADVPVAAPAAPVAPTVSAATPAVTPPPAPQGPAPAALVADTDAREIVVDTDTVRAVFNTRGAVLTSWQVKRYAGAGGQPLDLVPRDLAPSEPRPFSLKTGDAALDRQLANALFKPTVSSLTVPARESASLGFEYRDASGLAVRKQFVFNADGHPYLTQFTAAVERGSDKPAFQIAFGPSLGFGYNASGSSYYYPPAAIYSDGSSVERLGPKDLTAQARYQGAYRWTGVGDHYFLSAVIGQGQPLTANFAQVSSPVPGGAPDATRTFISWSVDAASGVPIKVFFGPKDFDILKAADGSLVRAIDFGMFAFLVVPLLTALKWVNGYIGNYGWAIIVLTLLINAIMAPLRHKSLVSMRKMQKLQPQVKAIQKRYENYKVTDPERQKMNTEMMALYRENGVNPASGCVPMLLTMPVLFAFYALLSVAIELRGAPWFGWIHDLSAPDPLFITPLLMGGTMFWQQYITPSTADPVQQKMMLIMPLVFLVMFLWAPAGLVLYWLFSNLWAIGQQMVTSRFAEPAGVTVLPAPAARRAKQQSKRD